MLARIADIWERGYFHKAFLSLALLLLALFVLRVFDFWVYLIHYPFQINISEGQALMTIKSLANGDPIYPSPQESFRASIYGPLYYFLGALFWEIRPNSFLGPRLVSFIAACSIAAGIAFTLYRKGALGVALLFGGAFFLSPVVITWSLTMKPDTLALALSLAGFCLFSRVHKWGPFFAAPLFVAAIYVKPTFIAAPAAVALTLLIRDRRALVLFVAEMTILGAIVLAILELLVFRDQHFLLNFITFNAAPYSMDYFTRGLRSLHVSLAAFPLLAIFVKGRAWRNNVAFPYYIIALLVAIATVGKLGSDANYFLESWVAGLVFLGLQIVPESRNWFTDSRILIVAAAFALLTQSTAAQESVKARFPEPFLETNKASLARIESVLPAGALVMADFPEIPALAKKPVRIVVDSLWVIGFMESMGNERVNPNLVAESADAGEMALWISENDVNHPRYSLLFKVPYFDVFSRKELRVYGLRK